MANRITQSCVRSPLPFTNSEGLYNVKIVKFFNQSTLSLIFLIISKLKKPKIIIPEIPRPFFSSLAKDETKNEIPPNAKNRARFKVRLGI